MAVGCCGVERDRFQRKLHLAQGVAQRRCQHLSPRRRHHSVGRPDEQFVLEHVAKPVQRMAHRRLAEPDAASRARYAALLHHSVEHDEQIQIESTPIHE